MKALPNLVIVGVPKAGTTSLFNYLAQHDDVCASDVKELDYFTPLRGGREPGPIDEYAEHFAHWQGESVIMEASPSYSFSGAAVITAMEKTLPGVRVVMSLRDPVARLWSAYTFQRSRGALPGIENFDDYVAQCMREREQGTDRRLGNRLIALSVGFYGEFLPAWLDAFGDRMRVVFAEQMTLRPADTVMALCHWLGIDDAPARHLDYTARNRTQQVRSARAGRVARVAASTIDRAISKEHPVRQAVSRLYQRANARPVDEVLSEEMRQSLWRMYRSSNAATATALRGHGYHDLPEWLSAGT